MTHVCTSPFHPQSNGKLARRRHNLKEAGYGGLWLDSPQTECYIHSNLEPGARPGSLNNTGRLSSSRWVKTRAGDGFYRLRLIWLGD